MSMITSQCDNLRDAANRIKDRYVYAADLMRDAADTILELRDRVQSLQREHDTTMKMYATVCEQQCKIDAENAKLRELCADLRFCSHNDCLRCEHGRFCDLRLDERIRELGIDINHD